MELENERENLMRRIKILEEKETIVIPNINVQGEDNTRLLQLYKDKLE